MDYSQPVTISGLMRQYPRAILTTWSLVIVENGLMVLIPLFLGFAIDGLLVNQYDALFVLIAVFAVLITVAVIRKFIDTRAYGQIRTAICLHVDKRQNALPVSVRTARLSMARELVDFLEEDLPPLFTAVIQIVASVAILASFCGDLAISAVATGVLAMLFYSLFHRRFVQCNSELNDKVEQQVEVLNSGHRPTLKQYLRALCRREIALSDTEALLYGGVFTVQLGFILFNLWMATDIDGITSGAIFSILSYSWEYVEAMIVLPIVLQQLSRLGEITERINTLPQVREL
ncbi:ABC transporter six-transmembrane domain-containing protein [Thaumasiovibrio subtropicus]|uniref:ABC transporter six-transmembrane domain-containing protein n=1 Tax=Thaumasiovibrio subtropicus TaxID=1891207 RepID=UPI00192CF016|nr:ABC transporter six-transmembrane domain-containing protein [Thaumasiovibrio subtropicus]